MNKRRRHTAKRRARAQKRAATAIAFSRSRFTQYQRGIVERLRGAGQVVVVVDSRHASTTPCDCDPSDDTKGAQNVHAVAARTPLVLRKSDGLDDWYVIERRDHDGRSWDEPTEYGSRFMASWRLIPHSDIEGTAQHMLAIADAIQRRSKHFEKRCAVEANRGDAVAFWSPKNSPGDVGIVTLADADELAAQIVAELGEGR